MNNLLLDVQDKIAILTIKFVLVNKHCDANGYIYQFLSINLILD